MTLRKVCAKAAWVPLERAVKPCETTLAHVLPDPALPITSTGLDVMRVLWSSRVLQRCWEQIYSAT